MSDYNPKTFGGIMIMGANGWRPIEPPNVTPAPYDKTLLEMGGVRQESNQAEWDYLHKAYLEDAISEQNFNIARVDIRRKPLEQQGVVFKDGRRYKPDLKRNFFGNRKLIITPIKRG